MKQTMNGNSGKIQWMEAEMGLIPKEVEPTAEQRKSIFVRHSGRYIRVLIDELLWVEAMENYVQLQTTRDKLVVHVTMKSIAEALASKGFRRIHRSFIVKLEAIESIEENHVIIDGVALPIGKSYRAGLLAGLTLI
jgi:DNA-binding LytR/AlgR family response regulator